MKELSIEEKTYNDNYKAYTELINRLEDVKDAIKKQNYGIAMNILCKPYPEFQITASPELKEESEDERIRKRICKLLWDNAPYEEAQEYIAWLDKQGKQNLPIEKLPFEMKTVSESLGFTTQKECDDYNKMATDLIMSDDGKGEQKPVIEMKSSEESLGIDSNTYNKIVDECIYGEQKPVAKYKVGDTVYYDSFGRLVSFVIANIVEDGTDNPMYEDKDGNSVFQNDIVELKPTDKVEPKDYSSIDPHFAKPIDNVEPKFKVGDNIEPIDSCLGSPLTIYKICDGFYETNQGTLDFEFENNWRLIEQKPAWSEEDEVKINRIVACLENLNVADNDILLKDVDWLKSLKERVENEKDKH